MENGEAMETNYFTTTESQDSGMKFLLPLLLFWKIIPDTTAQSKQPPGDHGGNLNRFKPLIMQPKNPCKIIWTTCCHVPILF